MKIFTKSEWGDALLVFGKWKNGGNGKSGDKRKFEDLKMSENALFETSEKAKIVESLSGLLVFEPF